MKKQIPATTKTIFLGLLVLTALLLFVACAVLFWLITHHVVLQGKYADLDHRVFGALADYRHPQLTGFMNRITFIGSSRFLIPAFLAIITWFLVFRKDKLLSFHVAAIAILGTVLNTSIKRILRRPRPEQPLIEVDGYSFPSGHSFYSFTFFGLLIYITWKQRLPVWLKILLTVLFTGIAATVAFSRIYLEVHYSSDVVAGFCLSVVWLTVSFLAFNYISSRLRRRESGNGNQ